MIVLIPECIELFVDTKLYVAVRLLHEIRSRGNSSSKPFMGYANNIWRAIRIEITDLQYLERLLVIFFIFNHISPISSTNLEKSQVCSYKWLICLQYWLQQCSINSTSSSKWDSFPIQVPFRFSRMYELGALRVWMPKTEIWLFEYI